MSSLLTLSSVLVLWATVAHAQADPNAGPWAFPYKDNVEYVANASNHMKMSLPVLQARLDAPNVTDTAAIAGFDWTQAYPGSAVQGHAAHLRLAYDVPASEDLGANLTSTITSLTFSIADSMTKDGAPKPMDPSWYICRHIYISSNPNITASGERPVDHTCSFLGDQCLADLRGNLTARWGELLPHLDPGYMCSGLTFDMIPESCFTTFGEVRSSMISFNSTYMANSTQAPLLAEDVQEAATWRIGTGLEGAQDPYARAEALGRTYLVASVWGYSRGSRDRTTPRTTFTCLQPNINATAAAGTTSGPDGSGSSNSAAPTSAGTAVASSEASSGAVGAADRNWLAGWGYRALPGRWM